MWLDTASRLEDPLHKTIKVTSTLYHCTLSLSLSYSTDLDESESFAQTLPEPGQVDVTLLVPGVRLEVQDTLVHT